MEGYPDVHSFISRVYYYGKILTYGRKGAAPTAHTIDSLIYNYKGAAWTIGEQPAELYTDAISASNYTLDLTNQHHQLPL